MKHRKGWQSHKGVDLSRIPYFTTAETERSTESTDFYITEIPNNPHTLPSSCGEDHAGHVPR